MRNHTTTKTILVYVWHNIDIRKGAFKYYVTMFSIIFGPPIPVSTYLDTPPLIW